MSDGRGSVHRGPVGRRVPGVMGSVAALACRLQGRRYSVEVVGDPADVLRSGVVGRRLARPAAAFTRSLVWGAAASVFVTNGSLQRRYPPRPGTPTVSVANAPLIEAMARALPAIGSDVGGIPELLDPSWLVPVGDHVALADSIRRLLSDRAEWEAPSRHGLQTARPYAAAAVNERFAAWLARVPPARDRSMAAP